MPMNELMTANEIRYYAIYPELTERNFNPMNDVIFKFTFGRPERKQITIDFLNTIVSEDLGHTIRDIVFDPTETIPDHYDEKITRLDVACTLDTGEQVDIEVQVVNQKNMQRRTMCYWARLYLMSLPPGGVYQDLKPCITVNLLRFNLLPQDDPHSVWSIYNQKTGDRFNQDLVFHFLEIPKYTCQPKKAVDDMTKMERWLAYFANQLTDEEKGELLMKDAAIQEAVGAASIFLQDKAERRAYINRELAILDYNSDRKDLLDKGRAEGENTLALLIKKLQADGRQDDISRALESKEARQQLYQEYHLI
ncbi:Rpn family recombination-promoting nuclease/putative transposase [uncultured Megasphaera sp.]|uniref:Rpn family recombination-promoting nuclease/putative transposase n=1 Tax=uncultured Megasphaera sp. TaxID=165188 RepID=UPI00265A7808|nr:Rpn family recombination-promoting nuclease/putative transposase [uncultured Megasphaera sp.]